MAPPTTGTRAPRGVLTRACRAVPSRNPQSRRLPLRNWLMYGCEQPTAAAISTCVMPRASNSEMTWTQSTGGCYSRRYGLRNSTGDGIAIYNPWL